MLTHEKLDELERQLKDLLDDVTQAQKRDADNIRRVLVQVTALRGTLVIERNQGGAL